MLKSGEVHYESSGVVENDPSAGLVPYRSREYKNDHLTCWVRGLNDMALKEKFGTLSSSEEALAFDRKTYDYMLNKYISTCDISACQLILHLY